MLGTDSKYPAGHPKDSIDTLVRKLRQTSCKIFHRKTYFFNFV